MSYVVKLYETPEQAHAAEARLRELDFADLFVVTADSPEAANVAKVLKKTPVPASDADAYAQRVAAGRSMLVVMPPFGRGALADEVASEFNPVDDGIHLPSLAVAASPGAPFSELIGMAPLSQQRHFMSGIFGSELSRNQGPVFSGSFGFGMLTRGPTPFSSLFGMGTKVSPPKNSSFGFPLLSGKSTPFSSLFGWGALTRSRTPFSNLLGWSPLARRPH